MPKPQLRKLFLIRHAEKPVPDLGINGVDLNGQPDRRGLSVRGWQRAAALVRCFAPLNGVFPHPALERPDALFAASARAKSERPLQTLLDLADELGLPVCHEHDSGGGEAALLAQAQAQAQVALVSWRHDHMATLARLLLDDETPVPDWDKSRFDLLWVFERGLNGWRFQQVPQRLLPGDRLTALQVASMA